MNQPLASGVGGYVARRDEAGAVRLERIGDFNPDRAMLGAAAVGAPALAAALHGFCPHAHQVAVRRALDSAAGAPVNGEQESWIDLALEAEAAAAAAFRFGAVWTRAFGAAPIPAAGTARRAADAFMRGAFEGRVVAAAGQDLAGALAEVLAAPVLREGLHRAEAHLARIADPEDRTQSLAARLRAIWLDGHARAERFADKVEPCLFIADHARGMGRSLSLRGPLLVKLSLAEGRIKTFESSAPTDRLLAPAGPLAHALRAARTLEDAERITLALDPCAPVAFDARLFAPVRGLAHA